MLSLNILLQKLFGWCRRPQLWATGDYKLHHDNTSTHASRLMQRFLVKHQITEVNQLPTAQIWHPATSGFSQHLYHLWKGRDFRPSMRFRKIQWGSWWQLGELCEVPRCLLWRGLRCQCLMYNISCICVFFNKCLYFSYYMAGYLLDRPRIYTSFSLSFHLSVDTHVAFIPWPLE